MDWLNQLPRNPFYHPWKSIHYRDNGNPRNRLYLALPEHGKKCPVLVFLHGGGLSGDRPEFPERFLNGEYAVILPRYRISPDEKDPDEIIDDAACSLAWVLNHAGSLGLDGDHLYLGGMSAGAYLAALVGMNPALLGKYGLDLHRLRGLMLVSGQMTTHFHVKELLKYDRPGVLPVIDRYAPLFYASADLPPMILVTGAPGKDMPARPEENAFFAATLRSLGHPDVTCHSLSGLDHGGCFESSNRLLMDFAARCRMNA